MPILFHENAREFHLYNDQISYIMQIMKNDQIANLYYGSCIRDRENFSYLVRTKYCSEAAYTSVDEDHKLSLQYIQQEYPSYGTSDFRYPAYCIKQNNGSSITNFTYKSHEIFPGKKKLPGLPATYVESEEEATTLEIRLVDDLINTELVLSYTIFEGLPVIARNVRFINLGVAAICLERVMSACVDLPEDDFTMVHLVGAWGREHYVKERELGEGIQGIYSMRGSSSAEHNPFIALRRNNTTQFSGEVYGFSLVYSGNHLEQVEVDHNNMTRVIIGIHPDTFQWELTAGAMFQTPEAVMVYSDKGINGMSQTFHQLFRNRLVRGYWRDKARPVLVNNWEATQTAFTEEKILQLAAKAKELGIEMLVLDDGWFGDRDGEEAGLGDWYVKNNKKLPDGIEGLADKIERIGLKFGLWFEPEMVNKDSDLYRQHPDWIIHTPGRFQSPSRFQHVLDFSRKEVIDYIYDLMDKCLSKAKISYVKWDMNRYITECYSVTQLPEQQGKIFHQYVLGVYDLYERLISKYPTILFESCSSGGARFDPGMLYYAPQAWASDNSDAIDRIKIQYGTSYVYPLSSIGAHVSHVPNLQNGRTTPLSTRGNVAFFGAFGYEMDLGELSEDDSKQVKEQVEFYKKYVKLFHKGTFYRMDNPFSKDVASWMVISEDRNEALVGYYRLNLSVNCGWKYLKLTGLDPDKLYSVNQGSQLSYGDELMKIGIMIDEFEWEMQNIEYGSKIVHLLCVENKEVS
ncbi:MAG: Alpha-galactosidase [Herbinix sp.]|jgi:alpha-galactosidase|nr:Alpha-galactosidase [Herbinix sp.]